MTNVRKLPYRGGSGPVNHAITSFNKVRLPPSSLLGSFNTGDARRKFQASTWRVATGSVVLGSSCLPLLEIASGIGYMYSLRRTVIDTTQQPTSIFSFSTQKLPIATALCRAVVMRSFRNWVARFFNSENGDMRVKHAVAACYKATIVQQASLSLHDISERCGAQGLFAHNFFTVKMVKSIFN